MDQNKATSGTMHGVNQEKEEALGPIPVINNDSQHDGDSLLEDTGTIYNKLEDQLVMTSRTPGQFSYK
jgi:hypothetical protein